MLAAARARRIDELETSTSVAHDGAAAPRRPPRRRSAARTRARGGAALRRLPQHVGAGADDPAQRGAARARAARRAQGSRPADVPAGAARAFRVEDARSRRSRSRPCDAPRVSIVIPVYGKPLLTFTCLKSVHAHTPHGQLRGDRRRRRVAASRLPTALAGGHRRALRAQRAATSASSARCNRGAALARGEILVFLNNDTIVTPGWLDALLRGVRSRIRTRASSARSSSIRTAGCRKRAASSGATARRGTTAATTIPDRPEYNYLREADYCSGACLADPARAVRASSAASTRATRRRTTRTPISRSPCAPRAARSSTSRVATIVHFEGADVGHRRVAPASSATRRSTRRRSPTKWAAALARAPRRTASRRSSSATAGRSGACWSSTRAC